LLTFDTFVVGKKTRNQSNANSLSNKEGNQRKPTNNQIKPHCHSDKEGNQVTTTTRTTNFRYFCRKTIQQNHNEKTNNPTNNHHSIMSNTKI
jgi:hypothetical protein